MGEPFEPDEDGAFGYPPCRAFFSEVPAGHNPVERQGKDDFPTLLYRAHVCGKSGAVPAVPTVPAWESRYELPSLNSQFLISLRINVSSSYERKQARTGSLPERSTPLPGCFFLLSALLLWKS